MGVFFVSLSTLFAQRNPALTVGDTLPAELLRVVRAKIPDTAQAVILDFMTSSCSSCILALPYEQELEQKTGGRVRFLVVTPEQDDVFYKGIRKTSIGRALNAPVITGDSVLRARFPFHSVSHLVWLSNRGVVLAITGTERLTQESVARLANGSSLHLPIKTDQPFSFDLDPLLLTFSPQALPHNAVPSLFNYSIFSSYIDGRTNGTFRFRDTIGNMVSFCSTNNTLFFLYRAAFNLGGNARCRWSIPDSASYTYVETEADVPEFVWRTSHTYCYQSLFPLSMPVAERLERIRHDLVYYTGITARLLYEDGVPVLDFYRAPQTAALETGRATGDGFARRSP